MAVTKGKIRDRISTTNWFIYILKLENDSYYVGISVDVEKRFEEHKNPNKKGSSFTDKNKPIKIIEVIDTNTKKMIEATKQEDEITRKYIEKYGVEKVRGGRYLGNIQQVNRKLKKGIP